ncbi:MAG TPA: secondary thiamine-phosphate synthase enzyme YjbQ [Methylophilaceae bacterium]
MRQLTTKLSCNTRGRGIYDITHEVTHWVQASGMSTGLLTLYIQHTSASLMINENYDSDVLTDMQTFFDNMVPDGDPMFIHTAEGKDDMPAHVRTALTQVNLSIPLIDGKLALGTWQGLFVFEHRLHPYTRHVVLHLQGE